MSVETLVFQRLQRGRVVCLLTRWIALRFDSFWEWVLFFDADESWLIAQTFTVLQFGGQQPQEKHEAFCCWPVRRCSSPPTAEGSLQQNGYVHRGADDPADWSTGRTCCITPGVCISFVLNWCNMLPQTRTECKWCRYVRLSVPSPRDETEATMLCVGKQICSRDDARSVDKSSPSNASSLRLL